MSNHIKSIQAFEILDSRGNPTVKVIVTLKNGVVGQSSVPSGLSTGKHEAVEIRDHDKHRYHGQGVKTAVENINFILGPKLIDLDPIDHQADIDYRMIEIDGSKNKSKLGANSILGISQAIACAAAKACNLSLYAYLGGIGASRLPMPMVNILNGSKHADNNLDFQEFMIVPIGAPNYSEALRYTVETFKSLGQILREKGYNTNVGDEGGFAPQLKNNEEAFDLIIRAIEKANFKPGEDVAIAIDPAASSFYKKNEYDLSKSGGGNKSTSDMIVFYELCLKNYPIVSIEDGLDENDWQGFHTLTAAIGHRVQIVGDDILVTNPEFIQRAIDEKTCNAVLIKLNQIGTVTEAIESVQLCRNAAWNYVISHRSGETNDTFIADFAVAMGGGQIKSGSVCRGERIAKYNRLLEIEAELGKGALFQNPFKGTK
ncbi:MAG: phosphopyruvate hydratase [Gammaproteobacteria bacterium]|nr:phosphopyruvate hydratase [Gammaproteobacteria bacterium]MCW5583925.1 phosphopyruvate hydratase [Gammaproteobacteria bacterium]